MTSESPSLFSVPSSDSSPELSSGPQCVIPTLLGRSNYAKWYPAIDPILFANDQARRLIQGTWVEPKSPGSSDFLSPISSSTASSDSSRSKIHNCLHAISLSRASLSTHQKAHHEYEQANMTVCRFLRSTLALNVMPFVRQHTSAKSLYEQLIYLYGERAGIDMVGGPGVFGAVDMALQSRRRTKPSISRILEGQECDPSPIQLLRKRELQAAQKRRVIENSSVGSAVSKHSTSDNLSPAKPPLDPTDAEEEKEKQKKQKKRFVSKFTTTFPFLRRSPPSSTTSISSKTAQPPLTAVADLPFAKALSKAPVNPLDFDFSYAPPRDAADILNSGL